MSATPYERLTARFGRLSALHEAEAVLHWDMATMMPPGGAAGRGRQLAELKAVQHAILTGADTGDLLAAAEDAFGQAGAEADPWKRANLTEMRRLWNHATALEESLVIALASAAVACESAWRQARPDNDFAAVLPTFEEVLRRVREAATAKAERFGIDAYDALLDQYDPGLRSVHFEALFDDLEAFLPPFLEDVLERQATRPEPLSPAGPFPVDKQKTLAEAFMVELGFDFDEGRLDTSLHPFCGGTPGDVRITTRYDEAGLLSALMGVLHETGHALYERGLPAEWRGQPVGAARGMSVHESQSLLVEMQVCRSRPFVAHAAPRIAAAFAASGPAWQAENLYRLQTRVGPGLIRVDADEVTYPLHIFLRHDLERAMIAGDLAPADLPAAWNDGMQRRFGLTPPGDGDGCLQDIHWYDGAWGYFPTYTLGAVMAAQLFAAARAADKNIGRAIGGGDFKPLLAWLGTNIHAKGSLLSTPDLVAEATSRPLDADIFKAHLRTRYLEDA